LTMHCLTGGRFTLGIGRGVRILQEAFAMAPITTAQMEDFAGVMRRLFRGETIVGHDGPIGRYPALRLGKEFSADIPLGLVAFGPDSLALGGRAFDQVVLHTFFTDETLARCVRTVKRAAEQAGRDPAQVKVWSCFATIGDHLSEELRLRKTVGRLATYLQAYGDLMVRTNGWDPQVLQRFRADAVVQSFHHGGLTVIVQSPHHCESTRTHRLTVARRVVGSVSDRDTGAMRRGGSRPAQPRRGRRHPPRCHPQRVVSDRRGVPRWHVRRAEFAGDGRLGRT